MRVHVFDHEKNELGFGNLVGRVTIYALDVPDEGLIFFDDPEIRPADTEARDMRAEIIQIDDQPKIEMNDGQVFYGCQVWWFPLPEPSLN